MNDLGFVVCFLYTAVCWWRWIRVTEKLEKRIAKLERPVEPTTKGQGK